MLERKQHIMIQSAKMIIRILSAGGFAAFEIINIVKIAKYVYENWDSECTFLENTFDELTEGQKFFVVMHAIAALLLIICCVISLIVWAWTT